MSGRKRSSRILFFRIRKSETLIKYTVRLQEGQPVEYEIYKEDQTGGWKKGGERNGNKIANEDKPVVEEIEKAIDAFEASIGRDAYKKLF